MNYTAGPFGVPPIQSDPLRQAIGPMSYATQGAGGSMGNLPFAPPPPPAPMPPPATMGYNPYRPMGWAPPGHAYNFAASSYGNLLMNADSFPGGGRLANIPQSVHFMAQEEMARRKAGLLSSVVAGIPTSILMSGAMGSLLRAGLSLPRNFAGASGMLLGSATRAAGAGSLLGGAGILGGGILRAGAHLLAPAAPHLLRAGLYYGAAKLITTGLGGAGQIRDVSRAMSSAFGGMAGIGEGGISGLGVSISDQMRMGAAVRDMTIEAPFRRFGSTFRNFEQLLSTGVLAGGSRNIKDMRTKLKKALDTMSDLVETMDVTFEEAGKVFEKIRSSGFYNRSDMVQYAINSRISGAVTGFGEQRMLEIGQAGATMARGMGLYGAAGAEVLQRTTGAVAAAYRNGLLSEGLLREVGGGSIDYEAAAQRLAGAGMSYLRGQGQFLVAAAMTPEGSINPEIAKRIARGEISLPRAIAMGERNIRSYGGMSQFIGRRQQLTSQFLRAGGGGMIPSMLYQTVRDIALETTGSADEGTMIAIAKTQFGLSEQEAEMMVRMGNPEAVMSTESLERRASQDTATRAVVSRYGTLSARVERSIVTPFRGLIKEVQEPFADFYSMVARGVDRFYRGESGQIGTGEVMTPGIRRMLLRQKVGNPSMLYGRQAEESLLQRGLEEFYSGAGGAGRGFKTFIGALGDYEKITPASLLGARRLALAGGSGAIAGKEFLARQAIMRGGGMDILSQAEAAIPAVFGRGPEKMTERLTDLVNTNKENLDVAKKLLAETKGVKEATSITKDEVKKALANDSEFRNLLAKTFVMSDLSSKSLGAGIPQFDLTSLIDSIRMLGATEGVNPVTNLKRFFPDVKLSSGKVIGGVPTRSAEQVQSNNMKLRYLSLINSPEFYQELTNPESELYQYLETGGTIKDFSKLIGKSEIIDRIGRVLQESDPEMASRIFSSMKRVQSGAGMLAKEGDLYRYLQSRRKRFGALLMSDKQFQQVAGGIEMPEEYKRYLAGEDIDLTTAQVAQFSGVTARLEAAYGLKLAEGGITPEERAQAMAYGVTPTSFSKFRSKLIQMRKGLLSGDESARDVAMRQIAALAKESSSYLGEDAESIQKRIVEALKEGKGKTEDFLKLHFAQQQGGTMFATETGTPEEVAVNHLSKTIDKLDTVLTSFVERMEKNVTSEPVGNSKKGK